MNCGFFKVRYDLIIFAMARTTPAKATASTDTGPEETPNRVTSFFSAAKVRIRQAAPEGCDMPMCGSENPTPKKRRTVSSGQGQQLLHHQKGRYNDSERMKNAGLPSKDSLGITRSQLLLERLKAAMQESEPQIEKIQQACMIVTPAERRGNGDIVTL